MNFLYEKISKTIQEEEGNWVEHNNIQLNKLPTTSELSPIALIYYLR